MVDKERKQNRREKTAAEKARAYARLEANMEANPENWTGELPAGIKTPKEFHAHIKEHLLKNNLDHLRGAFEERGYSERLFRNYVDQQPDRDEIIATMKEGIRKASGFTVNDFREATKSYARQNIKSLSKPMKKLSIASYSKATGKPIKPHSRKARRKYFGLEVILLENNFDKTDSEVFKIYQKKWPKSTRTFSMISSKFGRLRRAAKKAKLKGRKK